LFCDFAAAAFKFFFHFLSTLHSFRNGTFGFCACVQPRFVPNHIGGSCLVSSRQIEQQMQMAASSGSDLAAKAQQQNETIQAQADLQNVQPATSHRADAGSDCCIPADNHQLVQLAP
jgi:hypothetical protein